MPVIRSARLQDVQGLAEAHVASWKVAYRGMVPDSYLDQLQPSERIESWRQRIGDDAERIVVAEVDGTIVGFASYFIHSDTITAEFNTIYLHPVHFRKGLGRQLHDALVEDMRTSGCQRTILWVHPANERARRFYEACGWRQTGKSKVEPSWGQDMPAIEYLLPLDREGGNFQTANRP